MEAKLTPHIKISQEDARSDLPQPRLKLSASKNLSLTLPFTIHFAIEHEDALAGKTIIFEWSPHIHGFTESGFVLLHHVNNNLEVVAVDHSGLVDISRHGPLLVNGWNQGLWELGAEETVTFQTAVPARYQKLLKAGETYTLLWPGGEVALWEKGTVREHIGRELDDKPTPLILPGGPHLTFSTHAELPPWPMREEREARVGFDRANLDEQKWRFEQNRPKATSSPAKHTERDPDAPNLRVSLECPSTFHSDNILEVTVKVTYEVQVTKQPITFHTHVFEDYDNYQLKRLRNGTWENYDDESGGCGFRIVDDPDVPVTVGQYGHFVSLQPGESWTTLQRIGYNWTELPEDAENGETFRYVFIGETLDWWNWGSKADHEETVVKLPCYLAGPVVDPKDNDGRPQLVVQTSNEVEFSLVEQTR
ncbi:hypothetical protein BKA66DRAFT_442479 [Pyrenochaeta sp. MPI-SDFR-AT-0127]|nr:hypothetical protein BKA66DRAFT_442479 [Pyrenochaeta sp. MPI-SDFR-AT-0127]